MASQTKKKKPTKRAGKSAPRRAPAPTAAPTVVQLRFQNEGHAMAKKGKKTPTSQLHGAALAARMRSTGHHKPRKSNPGGGGGSNPPRRRRRNPKTTFVQALMKVAGATAAMFGSGVVVTVATSKIAPGKALSMYGIPVATALLGAGIATKYPLVGAGIAAGAAAPFVLPTAARMLQPGGLTSSPTSTVNALRAVAMGNAWRSLNASRDLRAVHMGRVQMGAHLYAT